MVSSYAIAIAAIALQSSEISPALRERALNIASDVRMMAGFGRNALPTERIHPSLNVAEYVSYEIGQTWIGLDTRRQSIRTIRCEDRGNTPATYPGDVRQDLEAICQREYMRMNGEGWVSIDQDSVAEDQVGTSNQVVFRTIVHFWRAPGIREATGDSWEIDALTSHPYSVSLWPYVRLPQNLTPAVNYSQAVQMMAQRYLTAHPTAQLEEAPYIRSMVMVNPRMDGCPVWPEPESFRLAKSRNEGWLAYDVNFNRWSEGRLIDRIWGRMDAMNPSCMTVSGSGGGLGSIKSPAKAPPKPWAKSKSWTVSLGRVSRKTSGALSALKSEPKKYVSDARILIANDSGAMWLANYSIKQNVLFWADGKTALQCVPPAPIENSILKLIQSSK